jgi:hypothetical protein
VASGTQRDQVLIGIFAGMTAETLMMNFKVGHCSAGLATPSIAL